MQSDPRVKNIWFSHGSMSDYFSEYKKALFTALETLSGEQMTKAHDLMRKIASNNGTFFVAGNGGSAAIAEHLCCDWTKGTYAPDRLPLRTQSLGSNGAIMSALANDFGYDFVFSRQLEMLAKPNDALFVISSSGNSPNIVKALEMAQKMSLQSIALTGFSGGKARELANISLHIDFANYAIVEDAHQATMQALAQYFFVAQDSTSKKNG